ncbi:MAG: hypothetical protein HC828_01505 [Blastochloris sp.]|nr:hypothetical protein [Blastochloris sp.]
MEAPITPAAERTATLAFARTFLVQAAAIPVSGIVLGNDPQLLGIIGQLRHIAGGCLGAEEMAAHLCRLVDAEITPLANVAHAEHALLRAEAIRLQHTNPHVARVVRDEQAFFLHREEFLRALAGLCLHLSCALRNDNRALAIRRTGEQYAWACFTTTVALIIDHNQRGVA